MNIKETVDKACEEPTLLDALTWICIWESERAIKQAIHYKETNQKTPDGAGWETFFRLCIKEVMEAWNKKLKSNK